VRGQIKGTRTKGNRSKRSSGKVKKEGKEAVDKFVEEERKQKDMEDREGKTQPMEIDIPETSTTSV
jgi:hypothetical protein